MSGDGPIRGGCACGACTYEVEDDFAYGLVCHCSQCRRTTGAASKPFGGIPVEKLRLTAGDAAIARRGDEDHDAFCSRCGALLWSVVRGGAWAHVTYGTMDRAPAKGLGAHIFVGSKAPWDVIGDDLPQFEEYPQ